jgi:hypothetical protein
MSLFLPANEFYFDAFERHMALVREMLHVLSNAVAQPKLPTDLWERIKALEVEADGIVREVMTRLEASFVTPLERDDIHRLTNEIDDMADALQAAASRIDTYDITVPTAGLREMVAAIDEMTSQLAVAVRALRTLKPGVVRDATGRADMLEQKIDYAYRDILRHLFASHPEPYDLVRWKDVYGLLEHAADRGKTISQLVDRILVRHT